tara:strand:+ start:4358 stop:6850 length:2493 start_codon:yes stop_codon:yes gene_type:complete
MAFEGLKELHDQMMSEEHKAQLQLELEGVERGIQNMKRSMTISHGRDGSIRQNALVDTEPGRQIFHDLMKNLVPHFEAARQEAIDGIAAGGRGVKPTWWWLLAPVPAEKAAFLTIRSVLTIRMVARSLGRKANAICLEVGNSMKMQTEYERWASISKEQEPDLAKLLMKRAKNMNTRQWSKWRRKIEDIETLNWTKYEKIHVGAKLLELLIEHGGGYFELRYVQVRHKTERQVFLTDLCRQMIDDCASHLEVNAPVLRPMIVPPNRWRWDEGQNEYVGGYLQHHIDFIRGGIHRHTADLTDPMSQLTLDAAHIVGSVWWQINRSAYDLLIESRQQPTSLFSSIPDADPIAIPDKKSDDEWYDMTSDERAEWKHGLSKIHTLNAKDMSKRESAIRKINIAKEMLDSKYQRFCYPQKIDSRTRFYPIPPDLNPQGDTIARGLIEFGLSEPLGPRGMYWMKVKMCNVYGEDKITFDEMQTWVDDNYDLIVDSVDSPMDGERFWMTAEKELEFYAAAVEYVQASRMDNPENFMSHQPSHQDGSNNGLQILSLLGRDPVGAQLTNCSSDPKRFDIYQSTADIVGQRVADSAALGDPIAQRWAGNISRATCKRACMTTSYGVTPRGIQDQLIEDGFCENLPGTRLENSKWLRDHLIVALEETVVASRPIMEYFQHCAKLLAEVDRPLRWRTPTGSLCQQSYWNVAKGDVKTVMGSYFMWEQNPDGGLNKKKQGQSSSPNVIHSLDAALLQKVVVELKRKGIASVATVHDSFAVHYRHTDEMRDIIRATAYQMFKGDWLRDQFHAYLQEHSPIELPEPPDQGGFDVSEVLNAPYFFS